MRKIAFAAAAAVAVAVTGYAVAAELKSGPQVGEQVPGPFHPLNCNGENAGKKACLYCKHGTSPVAVVFARTTDCPQTAKLLKKLDEATAANAKAEMGSYCVFLTDDEKAADKATDLAKKNELKNLTVAVDNPAGPAKYNVAKDADLTVIYYLDHNVKVNKAFKKGEITDADIDTLLKDVGKIVEKK